MDFLLIKGYDGTVFTGRTLCTNFCKVNYTLSQKIELKTNLQYEAVISILNACIENTSGLFPSKLLNGSMDNGSIKAVINPPNGLVDPFKSRLRGKVMSKGECTILHIIVNPSWVVIAFLVLWYLLLLMYTLSFLASDHVTSIVFWIIEIVWIMIPYIFAKLKLYWDVIRLRKGLLNKIKISA